jgi:hypothetical integral membrane protein (TIGR02206 family)
MEPFYAEERTFTPYTTEHFVVLALTVGLPFLFAAAVKWSGARGPAVERGIAWGMSLLLVANYVNYLLFIRKWGDLTWEQTLPMQMCDWAMVVIIVTLLTGRPRWFEVAYFWGIGGTLQAVLTPNLFYGFPDLRFISFFVAHSGIIVGVVFLILVRGLRPYPMSIVRVFLWSELYFIVALIVVELTGVNYGFLLRKPEAFTLLSYLSDWRPLYLFQMHLLALVFFAILYAPWAIADWLRKSRATT